MRFALTSALENHTPQSPFLKSYGDDYVDSILNRIGRLPVMHLHFRLLLTVCIHGLQMTATAPI